MRGISSTTTHEESVVTDEFTLDGSAGALVVHVWPNDKPHFAVLLGHGIAEHSRRYDHVAEHLVHDGAVVYAPDHRSHGRSAGEPGLLDDIEAMVSDLRLLADRIREDHPDLPLVLIGHSLGAVMSTRFVQRYPGELAALVLSGPVIGGNPAFEGLLAMDPLPEVPLDPAALSRDASVGEAYAADPLVYHGPLSRTTLETFFGTVDTIAEGPNLGDLPTLWIHGENDPLAPYDVTAKAFEHVGGTALEQKVYPGAMHEIFNETNQKEVLDDVSAFLRRVLN
jgi:alpha-beta hydrolase superfamily lysophospholipase